MNQVRVYSVQPLKRKKNVKSLIAYIYVALFIKRIKKKVKRSRHRLNIIRQWIKTEQSYRTDLKLAIREIKRPIIQQKLVSYDQESLLGSELQGMQSLSGMMLQKLYQLIGYAKISLQPQNTVNPFNPNKLMFGKKLMSIANGYKIYAPLFGTKFQRDKLIKQLFMKHPEQMKQIQKNLQEKAKKYDIKKQNITIADCLQQPLFRLFKYQLMMKQYLSKLPHYHNDYQDFSAARQIFKQINGKSNEHMKKLQLQERKIQLQNLLGKSLQSSMKYITQMRAYCIQFPVKMYIFNNFVLFTKNVESIFSKQEKYFDMELDQFSYVAEQPNTKYWKNILVLTGKFASIHLFFIDTGTRTQFFNCMTKVIREIRMNQFQRRMKGAQKRIGNKLHFTLVQETQSDFMPNFRVEVLTAEIRPTSQLTNQTVYITRFMCPEYYQDWLNFYQDKISEGITQSSSLLDKYLAMPKDNLEICQYVQLHLSQLQLLWKILNQKYPQVYLPDLNPISKDVNIYAKGRKKTRSYEVRCFLIQEFLNTVLRTKEIMDNNIILVLLHIKGQDQFFNYVTDRNSKTIRSGGEKKYAFGLKHCNICEKKSFIDSIQKFEHYRNFFRAKYAQEPKEPSKQQYCFNFYHIARITFLQLNPLNFNTLQRVLLAAHYFEGRLDYPFINKKKTNPRGINIYLCSLDDISLEVIIYQRTTVGQILEQIAHKYKAPSLFDFCLTIAYFERERVLTHDELVMDIVKTFQLPIRVINEQGSKIKQDQSFFSTLKSWGKNLIGSSQTRLILKKKLFLSYELEKASFKTFPEKCPAILEQIFYQIHHQQIVVSKYILGQVVGIYYCLKQVDKIMHFAAQSLSYNRLRTILPITQWRELQTDKIFINSVIKYIEQNKKRILSKQKIDYLILYEAIINLLLNEQTFVTYFVPVQIYSLGEQAGSVLYNGQKMILGVNFNQIILLKDKKGPPLMTWPIKEVKCSATVYSIFIQYQGQTSRLDGRMYFYFLSLVNKYQLIRDKFPQYRA